MASFDFGSAIILAGALQSEPNCKYREGMQSMDYMPSPIVLPVPLTACGFLGNIDFWHDTAAAPPRHPSIAEGRCMWWVTALSGEGREDWVPGFVVAGHTW